MDRPLRSALALAVLWIVSSAAVAMTPMSGPPSITTSRRSVPAESCLACPDRADWQACHETALALALSRDWTQAIAVEEVVHRSQPKNAEVAAVLARMYQESGRNTPRAFELYHEAMALVPGYPPALLGLGALMQDSGSLDVAQRYFERGTRERPDEPQFKVRLAEVLVRSGRDDEARPLLDEVVARWPGSREAEAAKKMMPVTALARP